MTQDDKRPMADFAFLGRYRGKLEAHGLGRHSCRHLRRVSPAATTLTAAAAADKAAANNVIQASNVMNLLAVDLISEIGSPAV